MQKIDSNFYFYPDHLFTGDHHDSFTTINYQCTCVLKFKIQILRIKKNQTNKQKKISKLTLQQKNEQTNKQSKNAQGKY